VAVFKGALLPGLAPEDFVVAVGVEGRVNVNEVNAGVGQLGELFQIVAAINDAGVEECGGFLAGLVVACLALRGSLRTATAGRSATGATPASDFFAMRGVCAGKFAASIRLH
jgi:hypothetical protein